MSLSLAPHDSTRQISNQASTREDSDHLSTFQNIRSPLDSPSLVITATTSPSNKIILPTALVGTSVSTNKRNYRVLAPLLQQPVTSTKNGRSLNNPSNEVDVSGAGSSHKRGLASGNMSNSLNVAGDATSSNTVRWVTREIAALDFLLNIPLEKEQAIVQEGWKKLQKQQQQHQKEDDEDEDDDDLRLSDSERTSEYFYTKYTDTRNINRIAPKGTWWEKWIKDDVGVHRGALYRRERSTSSVLLPTDELERPTLAETTAVSAATSATAPTSSGGTTTTPSPHDIPVAGANPAPNYLYYAPGGRRLEGDDAVRIQIPVTINDFIQTKQKTIARQAAIKQWEIQTAHGLNGAAPLLDGRIFFSANSSYPISVFSMIRYEPKREEAAFRRRKLEAIGGGGSQFAMPVRDWRGISYRAVLPRRVEKYDKKFNRFIRKNLARTKRSTNKSNKNNNKTSSSNDDIDDNGSTVSSSSSSSSSDSDDNDEDWYVPGLLDDPEMVLGRHRNVMIGDHVTGPMVASTIQFVEPALLKAELNKQFRERFDGWEPPKAARKYIGARIIQGNYVLMDPTDDYDASRDNNNSGSGASSNITSNANDDQSTLDNQPQRTARRPRQGSIVSTESGGESVAGGPTPASTIKEKTIRMPPSLTLSKIRSIKAQALQAAVRANLEISTVALACVYFERLCLDCRVDKSNRRLAFAACLLLSAKLNESNTTLVMMQNNQSSTAERTQKNASAAASGPDDGTAKESRLQALIRPSKRSSTMFASLFQFFTQDWSLSLKHLFDAEWGVFAALGFSLGANPTHIAFHFKRLMKALERNPVDYLGREMYSQWQRVLADEEERRMKRERKNEERRKRKEERILNMHIEIENEVLRRKNEQRTLQSNGTGTGSNNGSCNNNVSEKSDVKMYNKLVETPSIQIEPHALLSLQPSSTPVSSSSVASPSGLSTSLNNLASSSNVRVKNPISFLHRFTSNMRRSASQEKITAGYHSSAETSSSLSILATHKNQQSDNGSKVITALQTSPSMPEIASVTKVVSDPGMVAIAIHPEMGIGYDMEDDEHSTRSCSLEMPSSNNV